jgi:prevent-host-death family protein
MGMSIAEAKSQFSAVVNRAMAGEETTITRHGKAVAKVVPIRPAYDPVQARQAFEELIKLRKGVTLGDLKIKDLIEQGRM